MARPSQREQILVEASRLFSKKGYHATTIREIAQNRGILSGSLYAHISSKEDLLFEIVDDGADAFLSAITAVSQSDRSPIEKLRMALCAHIQVIAQRMDATTVFFHEWEALSEERRHLIQTKRDEYEAHWNAILQEGIDDGSMCITDPKFVRLMLLSVANWLYHWYRPSGPLSPDEIAERFIQILVNGIEDTAKERDHRA
ncbi:TetR/AcrR family transcriptional regulator [Alicyclobacillus fastidiosus]|uniref:TetR/AcrR family transcriptional regulator n=1 Tax=Alicyclobacillus fastidiosus TaxID=392011 RepID=A0ABY6ZAZ3_9BACL|nr:TetR/AcrR family transcriptional regulator [Alicyclobacillus fastidiosus]WAH39708.1 TetR/AcrR family transcriptional regulator [Alicyclobacillus fastidiosus]GMA60930.1 TetR family transcriptional regulator [Alicyclobacillus fastidiosus]